MSLDFIPLLGVTGKHHNIHYGFAYAGHGLAQALYMGEILGDTILGNENKESDILKRNIWSWPPEPIRWTGGQILRSVLTLMDQRIDRKIRRASGS